MGIIITSDIAKQYLLTEDAVEGFNTAVQNGQIRLALEIMVELVDGIMQVLDYITEDEVESSPEPVKETKVLVEEVIEPVKEEVKAEAPAKKPAVKEEKVQSKTEAE
jgi:hypothetical protein